MNLPAKMGDIDVVEIIKNPVNYPSELVAAVLLKVQEVSSEIREAKIRLEEHILSQMREENASKMILMYDGEEKTLTRRKGAMQCREEHPDMVLRKKGYDPCLYGDYIFKLSWSKSKEAMKFGGEVQTILQDMFEEGRESLSVK